MNSSEEQLESLSRKIDERERRARRIAWLVTVIPIIFAGLLLAYTIRQISIKQAELNQIEKDASVLRTQATQAQAALAIAQTDISQANEVLATATAQLDTTTLQLATTTAKLGDAQLELNQVQAFAGFGCRINDEVLKEYLSNYTTQAQVFGYLQEKQYGDVPWNPSGFSETEGFDSPNFALYVLQKYNLISPDYQPGTLPWQILPTTSIPENGDIVFYESGYTMFYYKLPVEYGSSETRECVLGMTPLRVKSLDINFAKQLGFLKVSYP